MRRMVIHARYHRGAGVQDSGANLPHNGAITQDGQRETVSGGASAGGTQTCRQRSHRQPGHGHHGHQAAPGSRQHRHRSRRTSHPLTGAPHLPAGLRRRHRFVPVSEMRSFVNGARLRSHHLHDALLAILTTMEAFRTRASILNTTANRPDVSDLKVSPHTSCSFFETDSCH